MRKRLVERRSRATVKEARVKRSGSTEDLIGSNGEFNAQDKNDLVSGIVDLLEQRMAGNIGASMVPADDSAYIAQCTEMVEAALADQTGAPDGGSWVLAQEVFDAVYETMGRAAWFNRLFFKKPVKPGEDAKIRVHQRNVVSWIITRETLIPRATINARYLYPDTVSLAAWFTIDDAERAMAPVELMDEKYNEILDAVMVREDNLGRYLFTTGAAVFNNVYTFAEMTPALFNTMKLQVGRHGLNCNRAVAAIDLTTDFLTNSDFINAFEPVTKLTAIEEGALGSLYGVEIIPDGLEYEPLTVLNPGEIFFCSEPRGLGGFCEYQPLQIRPADMHHVGVAATGHYGNLVRAYGLGNSRGVCWGTRSS